MTDTDVSVIPTHISHVVRTERLSEHFQRVTFGGVNGFRPVGADQFVYVLLPPTGRDALTIDETFRWTQYDAMPEAERPVGAYYTVRAFRHDDAELDCDFFLHDPAGPASAWAAVTSPGSPAALWGPRTAFDPPATTNWWLLLADETGLPGVAAILDAIGPDAEGHVFVEAGADVDYPLPAPAGVEVSWLRRSPGDAPGITSLLEDAVREMELPERSVYAWGGAEVRAMTGVRKHLRHERNLERVQVSMTPYWRHPEHVADAVGDD